MPNRHPLITSLMTSGIMLIAMLLIAACLPQGGSAIATPTMPAASSTPSPTATATATAIPTPVPAPQGAWSQYWNSNLLDEIVLDGNGYLWGRGSGSIIRWDPQQASSQVFGVQQGLPANTADAIFIGPEGKIWLSIDGFGFWRFDDPDWMNHLEQGVVEGTHLYAQAVGKDGSLWVCTDEGFAVFEDEEWYSIHQEGGLDPGLCEHITIDHQGTPLLIGTLGLTFLHRDLIEFVEFDLAIDYSDPLAAETAPNGDLWFAFGDDHILQWNVKQKGWFAERQRPKSFALTSDGQAWIIDGWGGFGRPDDLQTFEFGPFPIGDFLAGEKLQLVVGWHWNLPFSGETPDHLYDLYPGVKKEMWVTTSDGLMLIRGDTFEVFPFEGTIVGLVPFGRGKAYLLLTDGIGIFENGSLSSKLSTPSPLNRNSVTQMLVDAQGKLWLGSPTGLQTFDGVQWTTEKLPKNALNDLVLDRNGNAWVSHGTFGFSRWDGREWHYVARGDLAELPDTSTGGLAIAGDGNLWVGFDKAGIAVYDGARWKFYAFPPDQVPTNVHSLIVDGLGQVVVAADHALYFFADGAWEVNQVDMVISSLLSGPGEKLWAGTSTEGLYLFEEGELQRTDYPPAAVRDLALAPDGSLWAASDDGAWRFDGYQWFRYGVEDGLRTDNLTALTVGADGTLWFSGGGLTRFGLGE